MNVSPLITKRYQKNYNFVIFEKQAQFKANQSQKKPNFHPNKPKSNPNLYRLGNLGNLVSAKRREDGFAVRGTLNAVRYLISSMIFSRSFGASMGGLLNCPSLSLW